MDKKIQYTVAFACVNPNDQQNGLQAVISRHAAEGWEYVNAIPYPEYRGFTGYWLVFKK